VRPDDRLPKGPSKKQAAKNGLESAAIALQKREIMLGWLGSRSESCFGDRKYLDSMRSLTAIGGNLRNGSFNMPNGRCSRTLECVNARDRPPCRTAVLFLKVALYYDIRMEGTMKIGVGGGAA